MHSRKTNRNIPKRRSLFLSKMIHSKFTSYLSARNREGVGMENKNYMLLKIIDWIKWKYRNWRICHLKTGKLTETELLNAIKTLKEQNEL